MVENALKDRVGPEEALARWNGASQSLKTFHKMCLFLRKKKLTEVGVWTDRW